jgi:hypothetical protein
MSYTTTQYVLSAENHATKAGVVICNSDHTTYPTAPDPIVGEDTANPMSNLITWDRCAICAIGPGQLDTLNIDLKLAAASSVKVIGFHGANWWPGSTYPATYKVYYSTAGSYPSSWTNFIAGDAAKTWLGSRDSVTVLAGAVAGVTFVRFTFLTLEASIGFNVGKFLLAAAPSDLGVLSAPGATYGALLARSRVTSVDGRPTVTEYGATRELLTLPFINVGHTIRTALVTLGRELRPFLLRNGVDGTWAECLPAVEGLTSEHVWGQVESAANLTDVWSATLTVETLY